jgi:hypothetical protein
MQTLTQTQRSELQILSPRSISSARLTSSRIAHGGAEQVGQGLQRCLGLLRPGADQRQHGIQRVEQEMRPDARIQGSQPASAWAGDSPRAQFK